MPSDPQAAVDRYLKNYHRVKTLYDPDQDIDFLHLATEIAKHVIKQYIALIEKEKKHVDSPYGYTSGGAAVPLIRNVRKP